MMRNSSGIGSVGSTSSGGGSAGNSFNENPLHRSITTPKFTPRKQF